jgi:hypothetical protein
MFKCFVPCFVKKMFVCGKSFVFFWFFWELNIGEEKEENIQRKVHSKYVINKSLQEMN